MKKETITITITLPKDLAEKVEEKSKVELRSRSGQIAHIIHEHFEGVRTIEPDESNRHKAI